MGYLFFMIALLSGSVKGYCGKKISHAISNFKSAFYANTLRMLLCTIIGVGLVFADNIFLLKVDMKTFAITALSGVFSSLLVVTWIFCVRRSAYTLVDVFLMLGGVVTIAMCNVFFNEPIYANQYIGFLLLLTSSVIMCSYSAGIKGAFNIKTLLLMVACGVSNGMADFSQKLYIYSLPEGSIAVFNFYTYLFSFVILVALYLLMGNKNSGDNYAKSKKTFIYIVVMAACLFANSYFKTLAARYIDSAILYPLIMGASLVISTLMAAVFFKERLTRKSIVGVIVALVAIVILNL